MFIFIKCFFLFIEIFFFFYSNVMYPIGLQMLNNSCIPGITRHSILENDSFSVPLKFICLYLIKNFYIYTHQEHWFVFFSRNVLFRLWYQSNAGLVKWVWEYAFLIDFLEEFKKNWHWYFLKCLVKFTSKALWPLAFLAGRFFITDSVFLQIICLLKLCISSWLRR